MSRYSIFSTRRILLEDPLLQSYDCFSLHSIVVFHIQCHDSKFIPLIELLDIAEKSRIDRRTRLRRNEVVKLASNNLTLIGAFALIALTGLPIDGMALTWSASAALGSTGVVTIGLAFFLLRFIDPSV